MRPPTLLLGTLLLAGALAGCGDDDPSAADPSTSTAGQPAAGETVTVAIGDFVFDPTPVDIRAGDAVVWENTHTQAHTSTGNGEQMWNTGNLDAGASSEPVRFEQPGTYTYLCALHPFMEGTVEVSA